MFTVFSDVQRLCVRTDGKAESFYEETCRKPLSTLVA